MAASEEKLRAAVADKVGVAELEAATAMRAKVAGSVQAWLVRFKECRGYCSAF